MGLTVLAAAAGGAWARRRALARLEARLGHELDRLRSALDAGLRDAIEASSRGQAELGFRLSSRVDEVRSGLSDSFSHRFHHLQQAQAEALGRLEGRVATELARLGRESQAQLERIRATVDERLQATLEARLGESFRLVSERLEQVHQGLGEMQALAAGVGDLKRVLTNVRSRGTFGEVQLEALLEQVLAPAQYDKNVATVPGSRERVEFAVRLPGRDADGSTVYLPIDAKFPQEDYLRLQDAYEAGDAPGVEACRRALAGRLAAEAAAVRAKYVAPPHTTDFALLFVPTEGLYAEALRLPGLTDALQRDAHVVLVGPTTLYAVLTSLQVGFHTLAIERRSSEVWRLLAGVKAEFARFGQSLAEVKKKLHEASAKIELSERRSRAVERSLRGVEGLPGPEVEEGEP
ncbi:MAG: DNA recombination protein RmuC [Deferrisomatales bacterium]